MKIETRDPALSEFERMMAERKRAKLRIARLAECGVSVGDCFRRNINQADRHCRVYATRGTRYAYAYEMPAGGVYFRVGNTATGTERTVSRARLPRWAMPPAEVI